MSTPDPILVQDPVAFAAVVERFRSSPVVGIDTEAASIHRFHDRVYLLQISTPEETVVIDPMGVQSLHVLGEWMAGPSTEFVFHDADYDLRLLHKEYGFRVQRHFDTRVAAQFLGLESIGLAAILADRFGVATNKRWQRADWSSRPLSDEMIRYAATDTRYLPVLRGAFRNELDGIGRLKWVEEECEISRSVQWAASEPPESAFLRVKGARDLDRRGLAILRELYVWREQLAAKLDRALFRIIGTETLVLLASRRPRTLEALAQTKGVGADLVARRGQDLLGAIERGLAVPEHGLPGFERRPRFKRDPALERRLERLKGLRVTLADRLKLPPGLIAPNATLEAVARGRPQSLDQLVAIEGVRRWQAAEFGAELLAALGA